MFVCLTFPNLRFRLRIVVIKLLGENMGENKKSFWKSFLNFCFVEICKVVFIVTAFTGMAIIAIKAWGV